MCEQLETEWNPIHYMESFELSLFGQISKMKEREGVMEETCFGNPELVCIHIVFWVKDLGRSNTLIDFI